MASSTSAVSVKPGHTAFTVTWRCATSSASARVSPIDAVLGRAVRRDVGIAAQPRGARDIDDAAEAALEHPGQRGANAVIGARKIDRQHGVPQLVRRLVQKGRSAPGRRC
jgi:hypothetical protein